VINYLSNIAKERMNFTIPGEVCFSNHKPFSNKLAAGLKKEARLIEKETNELRTSNVQRPTSNNVFCQFKKRLSKAKIPFEIRFG
jgi:hypothetical protein